MAVFTAFFCGTGSSSFDFSNADYHSGELVSTLARQCTGMEFVDWIVADGPGSGNFQEDEKFVKPGNYSTARGVAFGSGWEENVAHALAMIHGDAKWSRTALTELNYRVLKEAGIPIADRVDHTDLFGNDLGSTMPNRRVTQQQLQMQKIKIFRKNKPVTQINAIGWSRGAVTTHMFANALALDPVLKNVPVNIIAVDPVPGTGNFQHSRTSISSNVRSYLGFYARDERSLGFAAVLPSFSGSTRATIIPLPGRHATLVGNAGDYIGGNGHNSFFGPGRVVRMLAEHYLQKWGARLVPQTIFSEFELLKCYDEMVGQASKFEALSKTTYTTTLGQSSDRDIGIGQNWTNSKFSAVEQFRFKGPFINWHHAELYHKFKLGGRQVAPNTDKTVQRFLAARVQQQGRRR